MTWLAPLWLAVGGLASLGAVALHFITTSRAPREELPTARFVPGGVASASARSRRPTDLLLLALRVFTVLLLAAAFARPVWRTGGAQLRRVVIADRSRAAQDDLREATRAEWRAGDALVLSDSIARATMLGGADSIARLAPTGAPGSLSGAMVAARSAARVIAQRADSIELVIVSPFSADAFDSATTLLVRAWPGRVRVVRTRAAPARWPSVVVAPASESDALVATAALVTNAGGRSMPRLNVRVVRTALTAADSALARAGGAVVLWPREGAMQAVARGAGPADGGAAGITDGRATVVGPFARFSLPAGGYVVARWSDGSPAASETPLGRGCVRAVGIGLPEDGDIGVQPAFVSLAYTLVGPCAADAAWPAVSDSAIAGLRRDGSAASAGALLAGDDSAPLVPWLLLAALLALLGESALRSWRRS